MAQIKVGDITPRNQYTSSTSQTAFTYAFPIFADADIKVYVGSILKTLTTDYTVSGAGDDNGGTVTFTSGQTNGDIITLYRDMPVARTSDYQTNGDFLADTVNDDFDKLAMMIQQVEYDLNSRTLRFGQFTTGIPLSEFTENATDRAGKVLAFDSSGDPNITQELGVYQGTDATTTTAAYVIRDIVKSTTTAQLNNIYICTATSPSGTALTNTSYWALIVDAVSAASSATSASSSASAAASSATAAASSATNAATSAATATTQATTATAKAVLTAADVVLTAADVVSAEADKVQTGLDRVATAADKVATNADVVLTAADVVSSAASASTATTQATNAATSATNAATSATTATTQASAASTSATSAATQATTATTQATAAAASATAAAASADAFDDTYLGAKSSDPTVDNDGDALTAGDMYFNTTTDIMKVYDGAAWGNVSVSAATVVSKTSTTGSALLPSGTTAQRDGSPAAGYLRWNSTETSAEVYDGSAWAAVGGGNSTTEGLYEHAHTINTAYSITSTNNAMSAGPVVIGASGSVTVPATSVWTIV